MSTRPPVTKIICALHKATKRAAALRKSADVPPRRESPQFDAMMAALEQSPLGATNVQLRALTGIACSTADAVFKRAIQSGRAVLMGKRRRQVYFSTAALMEASRARVVDEWAARDQMFADRATRRHHKIPKNGALPSKKTKAQKKPAIRVFGEMPLRQAKKIPTTQSAEWKASAPCITADTIVTICRAAAYVPMPMNARQWQHGHSGKFAS